MLRGCGVSQLVDVRSVPYSRYSPQFRKQALAANLPRHQIAYHFLGDALGGKLQVDYQTRAGEADFQAGIDALVELGAAAPTAIMCAEADPSACHRRLLVTPALIERGARVVHILRDGMTKPESAMADPQLGLFSG